MGPGIASHLAGLAGTPERALWGHSNSRWEEKSRHRPPVIIGGGGVGPGGRSRGGRRCYHTEVTVGRPRFLMCYKTRRLHCSPMRWTEFKHVHMVMVITDSHGQKVPFEGRTCLVKLLLRWRGGYFWIWKQVNADIINVATTTSTTPWWPPPRHMPALGTSGSWPRQHLQGAISFGHPPAQGPCAAGQLVPSQWRAQKKDHEAPLVGDLMGAAGAQPARKRAAPTKMAGQQEASAHAPGNALAMETPLPDKAGTPVRQALTHVCAVCTDRMLLLVYTQQHCMPCTKSELDLDGMPALADRCRRWLPGVHWLQVRSGEWWTPRVSDPSKWWQPSRTQPLLPVSEVSGP